GREAVPRVTRDGEVWVGRRTNGLRRHESILRRGTIPGEAQVKSRQRFLFLILILWTASAFGTTPAFAQSAAPAAQQSADTRKRSTPYTGDLSIFETPGREDKLQINRVMDLLGISSGKNVADIGAGSGWFTVRAARRTGAAGQVYAVDINPEAIHYIDDRMQ